VVPPRPPSQRCGFQSPDDQSCVYYGLVQSCPPNELVIRLQPKEAIYMKTNVKAPGLRSAPTQSELDLSYHLRYPDVRPHVPVTVLPLCVCCSCLWAGCVVADVQS
jgi:hypothetical protein